MESRSTYFISLLSLGLAIGLGVAIAGFYFGQAAYRYKADEHYLTVKGMAEQNVESNLAAWEIDFREVDNDYGLASQRVVHDQNQVIAYLKQKGFQDSELEIRPAKVADLFANPYSTTSSQVKYRYIVTSGIRIRTSNVELLQKTSQQTAELIQQGIPLSFDTSDYNTDLNPNPSYYYTSLDNIRPQMLSDATRSAQTIAAQFAKDANIRLKGIRQANQGVFQISGRDSISSDDNNQNQASSLYKKVRLVTTIQYLIGKNA